MISASQLRAARALLGLDQRELAEKAGLSVPTIQRMEASRDVIRGNVESLTKLVAALSDAGVELIGEGAPSHGKGRGIRLIEGSGEAKRRWRRQSSISRRASGRSPRGKA
jgi:transcriptional regulator with XRE-family HTH domain